MNYSWAAPRRPFSLESAIAAGTTVDALRWKLRKGHITRVVRGVFIDGKAPVTELEQALAVLVATGGVASGALAGVLHNLDGVSLCGPVVTVPQSSRSERHRLRRRDLDAQSIVTVEGYPCTDGLRTMLDLATAVDDSTWEQALESALRKRLLAVADLASGITQHQRGAGRMRRVLASRPPGAPPTESLLETLAVQLIRLHGLPNPERQVDVFDSHERFVARVDLAWPSEGVFIELDGQHHKDQPVYDARRETAVVAATGWLPGRFTWAEVARHRRATALRVGQLLHTSRQIRAEKTA